MYTNNQTSSGYIATKRFLRDYPKWTAVVMACLTEAKRCSGEFAGAWVLQEAKKTGIDWFPNLRPLVTAGILKRTDITRNGRRAYYLMIDPEGVKEAVENCQAIN